jgi:NAD(P)-dependent dehydrogenase (short-subunit alcohol dehydrogenase family)
MNGSIVVTGGHTGIGGECSRRLLAAGAHVVVASRDVDRARRALGAASGAALEVAALDLASLASVRAFAAWLGETAAHRPPLRALVCNAGVQVVGPPERTADGFERTFGVNHLGHYLLVHRVLPLLATPARVVVVASGTHDPKQRTGIPTPRYRGARALAEPDLEALQREGATRAGQRAYSTSKLCNVLFTYALADRLRRERPQVTAVAYDPGAVPGTGLVRQYGPTVRFLVAQVAPLLVPLARPFIHVQRLEDAGAALARLAIDPAVAGRSGAYFAGRQEIRSSDESYERDKQEDLFIESAALVGLAADEIGVSVDPLPAH